MSAPSPSLLVPQPLQQQPTTNDSLNKHRLQYTPLSISHALSHSLSIYIFTCTVFVSLSIFDSLSVCLSICKLISVPLCLPVSLSCSFSIALCPFPCLRLITLLCALFM